MHRKECISTWIPFLLFVSLCLAGYDHVAKRSTNLEGELALLMIDCLVAYRSSVTVSIEQEKVLTLSANEGGKSIVFDDLEFHAQYWSSGEEPPFERGFKVWVTTVGSDDELVAQFYELSRTELPRNQFLREHGFTSLSYVYHPTSRAELQYMCEAR
jgi:hypothetical protein